MSVLSVFPAASATKCAITFLLCLSLRPQVTPTHGCRGGGGGGGGGVGGGGGLGGFGLVGGAIATRELAGAAVGASSGMDEVEGLLHLLGPNGQNIPRLISAAMSHMNKKQRAVSFLKPLLK